MSGHTPGPWHVVTNTDGGTDVVHTRGRAPGESYREVALDIDTEEDARLIAAAPDLLEALETILKQAATLHGGSGGPTPRQVANDIEKEAREAIAKATGDTR